MERRFIKDYKLEDGKPVYTGSFYYADITKGRRAQALITAAAAAVMYLAAAFAGNMMTRWWPMGAPFSFLLIFIPLFCYEAGRFYKLPVPMERRYYEGTFLHIGAYAVINSIISAVSAAAGIIWLFKTKDAARAEYFTPLLCAGIAVISARFFKIWLLAHKNETRKLP